jgi:radical SAM family protein/iron-sulfur cluster protein
MRRLGKLGPIVSKVIARSTETLLPPARVVALRTAREWRRWADGLSPELLVDMSGASMAAKQALFRRYVKLVEIETHARCNRVCWFCPNSIVDRRRNRTATDVEMLERVFTQLGEIDYAAQIKVARYSEPLTNPHLPERIEQARRLVPKAQLAVVTNTDYLTPDVLARLRDAGLNVLYMSIYLKDKETWSLDIAHEYKRRLAKKLGVKVVDEVETPVSLRCRYEYEGVTLRSACIDFSHFGTDRGGVLEYYTSTDRVGPCREPFETFVIDYTGAVMPCCNLRSDIEGQTQYAVADLSDASVSLFDVYAGQLAGWRRSMVGFDRKAAPCTTCRHRDVPVGIAPKLRAHLEKRLPNLGLTSSRGA